MLIQITIILIIHFDITYTFNVAEADINAYEQTAEEQ